MRRGSIAILLVAIGAAISACGDGGDGGGDEEATAVEETLLGMAHSENPASCGRLYTLSFMEQMAGGVEGEAAVELCEKAVVEGIGKDPRQVGVANVWIGDGEATADVSFVGSTYDGQTVAYALLEEQGDWKVDHLVEFVEYDRDRLLEGIEREMRELEEAFDKEVAACLAEGFRGLEDDELQDLALRRTPEEAEEIIEGCLSAAEGEQDA